GPALKLHSINRTVRPGAMHAPEAVRQNGVILRIAHDLHEPADVLIGRDDSTIVGPHPQRHPDVVDPELGAKRLPPLVRRLDRLAFFRVAEADDGADAVVVDDAFQPIRRELGASIQDPVLDDAEVPRVLVAIPGVPVRHRDQRHGDQDGREYSQDASRHDQARVGVCARPVHHRLAARRKRVTTQSACGCSAGGRTSDRFGRKTISNTSGKYHRTYTPPWSAYQNCTPTTTAADWAMTWARL